MYTANPSQYCVAFSQSLAADWLQSPSCPCQQAALQTRAKKVAGTLLLLEVGCMKLLLP